MTSALALDTKRSTSFSIANILGMEASAGATVGTKQGVSDSNNSDGVNNHRKRKLLQNQRENGDMDNEPSAFRRRSNSDQPDAKSASEMLQELRQRLILEGQLQHFNETSPLSSSSSGKLLF